VELTRKDKITTILNVLLPLALIGLKMAAVGHFATLSWWLILIPVYLWAVPLGAVLWALCREVKLARKFDLSAEVPTKDAQVFLSHLGSLRLFKKKEADMPEGSDDQISS
jgi:hypothetical protein